MMRSSKAVIGLNMLRLWDAKGSSRSTSSRCANGSTRALRPVGGRGIPARARPDAHRYMAERRNVGKVVLTI